MKDILFKIEDCLIKETAFYLSHLGWFISSTTHTKISVSQYNKTTDVVAKQEK